MFNRPLFVLLLLVGTLLAASAIAQVTTVPGVALQVSAIWHPSGVLLAFLLLTQGARPVAALTGAVAIAAALVVGHGWPPAAAAGAGLVQGAETSLAAWILRTRITGPISLGLVRHTSLLVGAIAAASLVGGLAFALWLGLVAPDVAAGGTPVSWWLADIIGMLLVTPALLAMATAWQDHKGRLRPMVLLEVGVTFAMAAVAAEGVFGEWLPPSISAPAFILPFLLWASFRFGAGGASGVLVLVAAIGVYHSAHGMGPFALPDATPLSWIRRTQGTSTMAVLSLMVLGCVVEERRRAMEERDVLLAKLQTALAELGVLQGLIPICAWCHRIRDDAGYWQRIEAYVEANTAATFSHSICPGCSASQDRQLEGRVHAAVAAQAGEVN